MKKRTAFATISVLAFAQIVHAQETQESAQQSQDLVDEMFAPGGPVDLHEQEINKYIEEHEKRTSAQSAEINGADFYFERNIVSGGQRSGSTIAPVFNVYRKMDWSEPVEVLIEYDRSTSESFQEKKTLSPDDFKGQLAIFRGPELCSETETKEVVSVTLTLDPNNKIAEIDEQNNVAEDTFPTFKCDRY